MVYHEIMSLLSNSKLLTLNLESSVYQLISQGKTEW